MDAKGERSFYPLFKLVTFRETAVTTGLRAAGDELLEMPLPDAVPPWDLKDTLTSEEPRCVVVCFITILIHIASSWTSSVMAVLNVVQMLKGEHIL